MALSHSASHSSDRVAFAYANKFVPTKDLLLPVIGRGSDLFLELNKASMKASDVFDGRLGGSSSSDYIVLNLGYNLRFLALVPRLLLLDEKLGIVLLQLSGSEGGYRSRYVCRSSGLSWGRWLN
jgi:hypothetical protein